MRPATEGVLICGLGVHPPDDATLEALQALEDCRLVFSDLADRRHFSWLKRLFPRLRRARAAVDIVRAAADGSGVGLAVWGHSQYCGRLPLRVEALCLKRNIPFRVAAANSPIGSGLARSLTFFGGTEGCQGIQAYERETLLADPSILVPRLPAVVFAERGPRQRWARLGALLARAYSDRHPASFQPFGGRARRFAVGDLRDVDEGGQVFILPVP